MVKTLQTEEETLEEGVEDVEVSDDDEMVFLTSRVQ
jgi:hypothetical protein